MKHASGRIDALLVCGGKWHDFDFARLELLKLLAEDERVRVQVASDYRDVDGLSAGDLLVTYTCDVRPDLQQQEALRAWVEAGGHWLALHGTNNAIDPPPELGQGPFTTPRAFPLFADTLGSQFLSHPTIEPYTVTVSPGAGEDPLVAGIGAFEVKDELYLCEYHGQSSRSWRPAGRARRVASPKRRGPTTSPAWSCTGGRWARVACST